MRALVTSEIAEVSGGLNPCPPCPPDGCPQGPDVEIPGRRPRRGPDATTGVGSPLVIDSGSINFHLFVLAIHDAEGNYHLAWASKPGAIEIGADDNGLEPEQWVSLWTDIFKKMTEEERSRIGNAMVTVGATQVQNPFTTSAGQFLTFLGAAIVKGDVDSAAFYCDQLERTNLNKSSKDVILDGLGSVAGVLKVFKDRFVGK